MAAIESIAAAIAASVAGGRVYPKYRPQGGALPAVVWDVISARPEPVINQSAGPALWTARVQYECVADSYAGLKSLIDELRAAVHLKSGTFAGFVVVSSLIDQYSADAANIDAGIYTQPADVLFTFYD